MERAALAMAKRLGKYGLLEADEVEGAARDIASIGTAHDDGYRLARELDNRRGWDCDFEMAEHLNDFSGLASQEIHAMEKAWFEAGHAPAQAFAAGARVFVPRFKNAGTVAEVYGHGFAKYVVLMDKPGTCGGGRMILGFEEVEPA